MSRPPDTDAPHPHGSLHNPEVAHEHSDINIRAVVWFIVALVITAVLIHTSMWVLFVAFDKLEARSDPTLTPLMAPAGELPPEPRLQTTPWQDLKRFHEDEERHLRSYGWIDEKVGIAHVPIDRAKALLLQRGLPTRAGASDPAEGTHAAASGESSGGRAIPAANSPSANPPAQPTVEPGTPPAQSGQPGSSATKKPGGEQ
jgi:hypothetical protein